MSNDQPSAESNPPPSAEEPTLPPNSPTDANLDQTIDPTPRSTESSEGTSVGGFGDYELVDEIARGGMGVVYRARQKSLNRDVAIKMILAGEFASRDEIDRFYTEAEAAAKLDHPNIVPIFDIGQHQGNHYFSMKLIDGTEFGHRLRELRNDIPRAVKILLKVCEAVAHAHERGILHRDLKPGNILLDKDDQPFVTDLGLARKLDGDSQLTRTGAVLGTPSYMPPEQASGNADITTSADVYSLGAILYEVLTGRPPFKAASPVETMMLVINEPPERPSLSGNVDRGLELICLKCLEKQPSDRYLSASALANDLRCWLNGEPLSIRSPNVANMARFWLRQNFGRGIWTLLIGPVAGTISALSLWYATVNSDFPSLKRIYEQFPSAMPASVKWGLETPPSFIVPLMLLFAASIVFIGFLTAWFVKPKNRGADLAAGAVVGLTASVAAFLFGLGSMSVISCIDRTALELATRVTVNSPERVHELILVTYPELIGLSQDKQVELLLAKTSMDYLFLIPRGLWFGMIISLSFYFFPCLVETYIAGPILRRQDKWYWAFCAYWEHTFPIVTLMTLIASAGATLLILGGIGLELGFPIYFVGSMSLLALFALWRKFGWPIRTVFQVALGIAFAYFFASDFNYLPGVARTKNKVSVTRQRERLNPDNQIFCLHRIAAESEYVNLLMEMGRLSKAHAITSRLILDSDQLVGTDDIDESRLRTNLCGIRLQKVLVLAKMGRLEAAEKLLVEAESNYPETPDLAPIKAYLEDLKTKSSQ